MTIGLVITAITAAVIASNERLLISLITSPLFIVLLIGELVVVMVLSLAINRMSGTIATVLFGAYAMLNGITLSFIFLAYTDASIALAFFTTAGTFGAMSAIGYFTKRDLSRMGGLLLMGLMGLLIAMILNLFINSSALNFVVSVIGVLIFTGLTAYDSQRIKAMGLAGFADGSVQQRSAIHGALRLYLDFINLFLFLLRLFGRRR
jgi:FtsH-binding integral membrane protein